ncbi:MAG: Asp23/Gls24 family envelope stress response protein [Lachnospiraceae bacterium]|nr:Asp23/Gls24 family envelope stress response protein [Lachnospiraceae bacterium]
MSKEAEVKKAYKILQENGIGEVQISSEVIGVISSLAAMEVNGVDSMSGNATKELISKLGVKNGSKGVIISLEDNVVNAELTINLKYGYNVRKVSEQVQEKVKQAINTMTGLDVKNVNVRIAGVRQETDK